MAINPIPDEPIGKSGCRYRIDKVLQEPATPTQNRVYLATAESQKFVLKPVSQDNFEYFQDIYRRLDGFPNVRLLHDTIPDHLTFVFKYAREDLLSETQKGLPLAATKNILKDTLGGLAVLHDQHIIHADVKANNILVDYDDTPDGIVVKAQLTDIEDGAHVPPDEVLFGNPVGNYMWRSPETSIEGPIQTPTDMFSFALVCIYAIHKKLVFAVEKGSLPAGETLSNVIIERQMSYFADPENLEAFLRHLDGDSPWHKVYADIRARFSTEHPRQPVTAWVGMDSDFSDLIAGLTKFDPDQRLTAHQALAHKWFADV